MEYIRTKEHIYKRLFVDKAIINECGYGNCDKELNPIGETIIKQADNILDLVVTGDLLIVEDTTKTYSHSTFPIIYNEKVPFDYDSPIYRIKEFYIKNNGNFIKVAEVKNKGELELL